MLRVAVLVSAAAFVVAACTTADEVDQSLSNSAVGVIARGCSLVDAFGTGVALKVDAELSSPEQTFVATSAHTVAGANEIVVRGADDKEHLASLVAFDADADVAILRVDDLTLNKLSAGTVHRGQPATLTTWNPSTGFDRRKVRVNRPVSVTIEDIYVEDTVTRQGLEINTAVVHGDSGGPVIDNDGQLLGIIYATSRENQLAYAVAATEITMLAERISEVPVDSGRCT